MLKQRIAGIAILSCNSSEIVNRMFHVVTVVAGLGATTGVLAQTSAPSDTAIGPRQKISCNIETIGMVCRAEGAAFVWCQNQKDLSTIEASAAHEPARRSTLIADATTNGSCGTTRGTIMNGYGFPVGTLEHPRGPEPVVSKVLFAAVAETTPPAPVQTIPTASSGTAAPGCVVGQLCTFAAPIFACDYAGAEKIAQAGPAQRNGVGMGLVRDQSCQTVPAGRASVRHRGDEIGAGRLHDRGRQAPRLHAGRRLRIC